MAIPNLSPDLVTKKPARPATADLLALPTWVDYSTISTYISCPYKALLQYGVSIKPDRTAIELVFGGSIHFALELAYQWRERNRDASPADLRRIGFMAFIAYWEAFANEHLQRDDDMIFPRSPGNAKAMLLHYFQTHTTNDRDLSLVGTEVPIEFLFKLTDSIYASTLSYIGRIDRIMRTDKDRLIAFEVKTSSVMSEAIFFGYHQSFQSDGYMRFLNSFAPLSQKEAPTLIYDILAVQKTANVSLRKQIMKLPAQVEESFTTLGHWINAYYRDWLNMLDLIHSREEYLYDKTLHLPFFRRSKGTACTEYMRACPYADLCSARANPLTYLQSLPSGFRIEKWDPRNHERITTQTLQEAAQTILAS